MDISNVKEANDLADQLERYIAKRAHWAHVELPANTAAAALGQYGHQFSLPRLDVDQEMHAALVFAIINEYDGRIDIIKQRLRQLGVTIPKEGA